MNVLTVGEATKVLEEYGIVQGKNDRTKQEVVRRWLRNGVIQGIEPEKKRDGWKVKKEDLDTFISTRVPSFDKTIESTEIERLKAEIEQLKTEIDSLKKENKELKFQRNTTNVVNGNKRNITEYRGSYYEVEKRFGNGLWGRRLTKSLKNDIRTRGLKYAGPIESAKWMRGSIDDVPIVESLQTDEEEERK